MDGYLFDTSIVIPNLRRHRHEHGLRVEARLRDLLARGDRGVVSVVTVGEVDFSYEVAALRGQEVTQERAAVDRFFREVTVLHVDTHTMSVCTPLRARIFDTYASRKNGRFREKVPERLRISGHELVFDERDLLIVSTAIQYNLVLALRDEQEGMRRIVECAADMASGGVCAALRHESWN